MSKKQLYILLACILSLVILLIILTKLGIIGGEAETRVAVEEVAMHDIVESVSANGKIYPVSEVKVSPDVSGEIIELNVEEGDSVRKGQVLATINSTSYMAAVNRANAQLNQTKASVMNANAMLQQVQAQLDQATSTFERNKKLYDEKVISAAEFEMAQAAYKTAKANYDASMVNIKGNQFGVESAQANVSEAMQSLRKTTIYAPMSGIVSALFVKKGERVVGTVQMAGTEMLRVANMSQMKVDVEVGENDIQKVKYGDTANIEVEAYPSRKFKGIVVKISQSSVGAGLPSAAALSEQVTNYTVGIELVPESYADLLQLDKRHFPFRPGMSATVDILTKYQKHVLAVPINAVTTREGEDDDQETNKKKEKIKEYVFLVNQNNMTVLREVETSVQDNEYIQITRGLETGEQVVIAPYSAIARTLKKDKKVKVVPKKELFTKKKESTD